MLKHASLMPYPFKNKFIATNPKSKHLDIPDFIIGWQNSRQVVSNMTLVF